jgi:uncharacterized protein (DUF427 family)
VFRAASHSRDENGFNVQQTSVKRALLVVQCSLYCNPEQTMKAVWNDTVIAESTDTVLVEGNLYFPASSLNRDYVQFSNHKTSCAWKGQASYYSLMVNGEVNVDAVWYYPKPEAHMVRDRVAFWKGVKVMD